jgi:DNA polymerase III subunit beta
MKTTLLQENFIRALNKTQRIVGGKTQLPILTHLLLKTQEGSLLVIATNLETTIQISVPAKIEEEGSICVPAKLLFEFISTLPKEAITLSLENEILTIKGGKSKATIPCVVSSEFPPVPEVKENTGVDLHKKAVGNALSLVLFSAATDESRPLLTGIRIEKSDSGTLFAATDGYRLSVKKVPKEVITETPLVIPSRALAEVLKIGEEEKEVEDVRLSETIEGQLLFVIGDTKISTRRIEGEYPNYRRIIPASSSTLVTLDTKELQGAVKSAAIFARDSAGIIRFAVATDSLTVSANTPQVGENTVEIDAKVDGEGGTIAVNSRFLLDLLNHFSGDTIRLEMTGALNPAVFKDPEDDTFLHIIMPVRVQA